METTLPPKTVAGKPQFSPFTILRLNGKYYALFSAILFLVVYGIDILFCYGNQLFSEACFIGAITAANIGVSIAMNFDNKYYKLIPANCFINFIALAVLIVLNGFSTGAYFYFVPTTIVFLLFTSDSSRKLRQLPFFIVITIFAAAIFITFKLSLNATKLPIPNSLFIYRLTGTLIFSAMMLRLYLPVFINKENLKVRKNYFEALFQSPLHGYIVFNAQTKEIIDFNKTVSLLFELPYESTIKGMYLSQFMMRYLSSASKNFEILMNNIPGNWQGEGSFTSHNKNEFSANINLLNYVRDDNEFRIFCVQDITNTKKSENQLSQYKESLEYSTKVKTRFLSSISHELRTPLNGIIGTANLLMEEPGISETSKQQLKLQLYSSNHMLSIVNDILDFSKIDSGKMRLHQHPFLLTEALQNVVNSFENQFNAKKINLIFKCDAQLTGIIVNADEVKLMQILNNLLSNALKFTLDGSVTIAVTAKNIFNGTVDVDFTITDTGIGINKEKQDEIFEGFTQVHADDLKRRFGGTGLGLAISQKLTHLFGGQILVNSELGKGASFYFSLGLARHTAPAMPNEQVADKPKVDIRGVRILIVEDNEINATVLKTFLTKWGIRIMEATHGVQALELLKYHKFDMIFMDLEMPEMNGYAATAAIRANNNNVPVIAFTATLLEDMETLVTQKGFNDYILKPFKPAVLRGKIEKFAPHRVIEYA